MRVTIVDIAKVCNVAPSTVSRIISGKEGFLVSQKTRQNVLDAAAKMGYRPNGSAQALVTGRTNIVGFSGGHLVGDQLYGYVLKVIRKRCARHKLDLTVGQAERQIDMPLDGMIIWNSAVWVRENCKSGLLGDKPVVAFGSDYVTNDFGVDSVGISMEMTVHQAMQHFLRQGCSRIAFCHDVTHSVAGADTDFRYQVYTQVMRENGLTPEYIALPNATRSDARAAIKEYVQDYGVMDAMLALNDEIAIGINVGLKEIGVKVPDDTAIIGCDGIEDCEYCSPMLSTIAQPIEKACELAADFLFNRISNPSYPRQRAVIQSELIIRESSRKESVEQFSVLRAQ